MDAKTYNETGAKLEEELNRRNTDYEWRVRGALEQILAHTKDFREDNEEEALKTFFIRAKTKQRYERGKLYIFSHVTVALFESVEIDVLCDILKREVEQQVEDALEERKKAQDDGERDRVTA